MIFIDMENKSLIEYLNIDEFSYIENNKMRCDALSGQLVSPPDLMTDGRIAV